MREKTNWGPNELVPQDLESQRPNMTKCHILNLSLDAMRFSMCNFSLSMWFIGTDMSACKQMICRGWPTLGTRAMPTIEGPEDLCHLKATQLKDW